MLAMLMVLYIYAILQPNVVNYYTLFMYDASHKAYNTFYLEPYDGCTKLHNIFNVHNTYIAIYNKYC